MSDEARQGVILLMLCWLPPLWMGVSVGYWLGSGGPAKLWQWIMRIVNRWSER